MVYQHADYLKILQLNIEGLTAAKTTVLEHRAEKHSPTLILLQETHQDNPDKLKLRDYCLATYVPSKIHGLAIFIKSGVQHEPPARSDAADDQIEWASTKVCNHTITNIYKPPRVPFSHTSIPLAENPSIYTGDLNSHHPAWGYTESDNDGTTLMEWATNNHLTLLYDPKQKKTFHSGRWGTETNPDISFYSGITTPIANYTLQNFPHSQHRPTLIVVKHSIKLPIDSRPVPRWNFRKAHWDKYEQITEAAAEQLPDTTELNDVNSAYSLFLKALYEAAKKSIPRGRRKTFIPTWDKEMERLFNLVEESDEQTTINEASNQLMQRIKDQKRARWEETTASLDFTHSSREAWGLLKKLSGTSRQKTQCPVTANSIAKQLYDNSRYEGVDKSFTRTVKHEVTRLKRQPTADMNLSCNFTTTEMDIAIATIKTRKAAGYDKVFPEFIKHLGPKMREWLTLYLSRCLSTVRIPKIWRRAHIIAILKPGKPPTEAKSYRPISLLSIVYKLLERLVLNRITPIVDPQLPKEQAGFRKGRCTTDQVANLTQHIEDGFERKLKTGLVLVDLTAAYDTVWLKGLEYKLIKMIPDRHLAAFVMELISRRTFRLTTSSGETSKVRSLKNGVPQGSVLAPLLFNIYVSDLPPTKATKYMYADDIALAIASSREAELETELSADMENISAYLHHWRLKLSESKTTSYLFHLHNAFAHKQLSVMLNGKKIPPTANPVYLGVTLDRTLTFRNHIEKTCKKINARNSIIRKLAGTDWGASFHLLRTSTLALVYAPAEYCCAVWNGSRHTKKVDTALNTAMRTITGCVQFTPTSFLPVLSGIDSPNLRRQLQTIRLANRALGNVDHILHGTLFKDSAPRRLKSRKSLRSRCEPKEDLEIAEVKLRLAFIDLYEEDPCYSRLRRFILNPTDTPPGHQLKRSNWTKLNRVRSGAGMFRNTIAKFGWIDSPTCNCNTAPQTADHLMCCPLLPNICDKDIADCNDAATSWLEKLTV